MPINILMPALSPTMEMGNLAKWLKKEGDKVKSGDVIAEIETDKATMEVEAVDEGTIAKILIADGTDNVAVNTPIAVLAGEGEDVSAAATKPNGAAKPDGTKQILNRILCLRHRNHKKHRLPSPDCWRASRTSSSGSSQCQSQSWWNQCWSQIFRICPVMTGSKPRLLMSFAAEDNRSLQSLSKIRRL